MADVQTQSPDPSPPIASLTGSSPIAGMVGKNTMAELAKSKREEVAAESKAFADEDSTNAKYLGTMKKYLDQEGVELDNAPKPWDADKEHKKFESDPIQGIGSVGSIFAVLASAFTKAPATNAIQGMAGAINAIKEGNESAYNRAYESYKQNIKLAMDREKIIHQKYMDAASLMQSNMEAANIKVKHIATQYGDHQVSLLWDAGLVKEAYEAIGARAKAADQLHELGEKDLDRHIRLNAYDQLKKEVPKGATPEQAAQIAAENMNAWRTVNNVKEAHNTPEQELTARIIHENPNASATDLAAKFEENGIKVGRQTERDKIIQERVYFEEQAIRDREGREPTAAESAKIREQAASMGHAGSGGSGSPIVREKGEYIEKAKQEIRDKEHREPTADELQQIIKKSGEKFSDRRIDQSIVNELKSNYPGMKEEDLGFIPATQQPRLKGAFESADRLEAIAAYAKENPDAIGLIADSSRKMNLDAYQGLFQDPKDLFKLKEKSERDASDAIDTAAKEKGLDLSVAAKAKVLQKMLTTQAFADAGVAGSRGATIYLDKAFREIYDQASSPGTFFSILEKRYDDANREASNYRMPFDERAQHKDMPFWQQKAPGFVSELGTAPHKNENPPVPSARKAPDGKWYVDDPQRPGKYLQVVK